MRPIRRAVSAAVLLTALPLSIPSPTPARNDAGPTDWQRDLRILIEEIEAVHPDPWFHAERAAVVAAADELHERLPGMTWEESLADFFRIVAMLGDGHTGIRMHRNPQLGARWVPVRYRLFPEGLRVISVDPEHAQILGGRVTAIGNVDADEAWARMEPLVPRDNEWTVWDGTPGYLTCADLLAGIGILEGTEECPVEVEKDGKRILAVLPTGEWSAHGRTTALEHAGVPLPLYLQRPERSYFLEVLPDHDAAYLLFRRVRNDEGESFEEFCSRAFALLEEQEVDKLIVDLRTNGGGNNFLNRPLIHGIIRNNRVNREGNLFVITGRRTFSAAMCGTIDLERQTEALFAGEPTGAAPNHHGDAVPVTLPNTGLTVNISALYWQNSDPRDRRRTLKPDVPVEVTWDDYIAGRDPVLATVLEYGHEPRKSIGVAMGGWLADGASVEEAIERYRAIRESDERNRYHMGEFQLNEVGYQLLGERRMEDALAIFRLNVETFPDAYNPWDSLGEELAKAGRTREAIEAYRRSVELNPASRSGQEALRRLKREAGAAGGS